MTLRIAKFIDMAVEIALAVIALSGNIAALVMLLILHAATDEIIYKTADPEGQAVNHKSK